MPPPAGDTRSYGPGSDSPLCSSRTIPMSTATSARLAWTLWVVSSWNDAACLVFLQILQQDCSLLAFWVFLDPLTILSFPTPFHFAENSHDRDGWEDYKVADCKCFLTNFTSNAWKVWTMANTHMTSQWSRVIREVNLNPPDYSHFCRIKFLFPPLSFFWARIITQFVGWECTMTRR